MKFRFKFQPRKKETVGVSQGVQAKAKLELIDKRLFAPKEKDDVEDIMVVERKEQGKPSEEQEFEAPDTAIMREVNRRTLGHGAIGGRKGAYPITARNSQAFHRLRLKYRAALERDPDRLEKFTQQAHVLFNDTADSFKERGVDPDQIKVEVVEQEPLVKYIPVPTWGKSDKWDDKKIE